MYYFLNQQRTLCHILEDEERGVAPAPCNARANKLDVMRYQEGKSNAILPDRPASIPLCKHCEKGMARILAA
jgi:hypothetical protein